MGNARFSGECPVHHTKLYSERCEVRSAEILTPQELIILSGNPNAGVPERSPSLFRPHIAEMAVCAQCRSNYLVATRLSDVYASGTNQLQTSLGPLEVPSVEGALLRNIQ